MPVKIMMVDKEPADLRRLERLFGLTYHVLSAGSGEETLRLLEQLSLAALLHDVGKISTPDSILLKPAALTDEERAVVRLHSERGARLLAAVPEMEEVAAAVRHHHENYDGTGYPEGLAGEAIPLASRVIHVADAYDAMTSPRPFRDALVHEMTTEMVGRRFDCVAA